LLAIKPKQRPARKKKMLTIQPNKGDIVKLPQGVITYKVWGNSKDEFGLSFFQEIKKPTVAIYVEKFNDNVSKLIHEDRIVYVYTEWLFELEDKDVSEDYNYK
jgi:hypothetical protein